MLQNIINNLKISRVTNNSYFILNTRFSSKLHWKELKKKNSHKLRALENFDQLYGSMFGKQWEPMRVALLRRPKYVALVNNYGDTEATMESLRNMGAHNLKLLMSVQENFDSLNSQNKNNVDDNDSNDQQIDNALDKFVSKLQSQEITSIYPQAIVTPDTLEISDTVTLKSEKAEIDENEKVLPSVTLEEALEDAKIDESRLISPTMGLSSESLYQYIPATKIKGMEEWIPESSHFAFYAQHKGGDFPVIVEPEKDFVFPEHLKVMMFERESEQIRFPEPKRGTLGLYNYYPMDMGSVAAVLALVLRPGDRVLDLCAAPGGKSLVMLQTLYPSSLFCNDSSISRTNRLRWILKDYLMDFETDNSWRERLVISNVDGRAFTDDSSFDKVLVDVPCTTDRESVMVSENNMFRPDRVKERLSIPEKQAQLLLNALRLVREGGAVVYSTCSLSPAQNDGVVHAALKLAFQEGILASIRDLTTPFSALSSTLCLGTGRAKPKYGQLVTPDVSANYGPSYIARLVRIK